MTVSQLVTRCTVVRWLVVAYKLKSIEAPEIIVAELNASAESPDRFGQLFQLSPFSLIAFR